MLTIEVTGAAQLGGGKETDEEILRRYRWDELRHECAVYLLVVDGSHVPDMDDFVMIEDDVTGESLVDRLLSITQGREVVERLLLAVKPHVRLEEIVRLFWTESYLEHNFNIMCVAMIASPTLTSAFAAEPLVETKPTSSSALALDLSLDSDAEEAVVDRATLVRRQMAVIDVVLQAEGAKMEVFGNPFIEVKHSWAELVEQDLFAAPWPSLTTTSSSSSVVSFTVSREVDELEFTDWIWRLVTHEEAVYRVKGIVQFKHTEGPSAVHCVSNHVDIRRLEAKLDAVPSWHLTLLGYDLEGKALAEAEWLQQRS